MSACRVGIFVSPLPPEHMRHVMLIRSRSSDNGLAESGDPRTGRLFRSLVEHSATMHRRLKPRAVTSQLIPEDTSYVARGHSASFVCGRARAVLRDVMLAVARGCLRDVPGRQRCALSMQHREVYRREGPPFGPLRKKEHVNQAELLLVVLPSFRCGQCCRAHRGAPPSHAVQLRALQRGERASGRSWHTREGHKNEGPASAAMSNAADGGGQILWHAKGMKPWLAGREVVRSFGEMLEHKPPKHDAVPAFPGCDPVGRRVRYRVAAPNVTACRTSHCGQRMAALCGSRKA
jgi:ribosomal protein S14